MSYPKKFLLSVPRRWWTTMEQAWASWKWAIDRRSLSISLKRPRLIYAPSCRFQITTRFSFSKEGPPCSMLPLSKIFWKLVKALHQVMSLPDFGPTNVSTKPKRCCPQTISQWRLLAVREPTTPSSLNQRSGKRSILIPHLSTTAKTRLSMATSLRTA